MGDFLSCFEDQNVTSIALSKKYKAVNKFKVINKLPFSSTRKLSAVEFENVGTLILGAPEFIIEDKNILDQVEEYTKSGCRVLLLAKSKTPLSDFRKNEPVEPICLFVLIDHIREEAYDTIKWFNDNDVDIKIISGDNPLTVSQIAKKVGVKNADNYISLDDLSDEEWEKRMKDTMEKIYQKAHELRGQVSGEHGIGFAKKPYLRESLPTENLELMNGIKRVFDPKNILNPHKVAQL